MRNKKTPYVRVWEFHVEPSARIQFERTYGPSGDWVQLFKKGKGCLHTELFRDAETRGRYLTVDYWISNSAYEIFRRRFDREFAILDKKCEVLTVRETLVGTFQMTSAATSKK